MCSWLRDLFNVWEIIDNISEMVQNGDIWLQWKTNRKLYVAYRMAPLTMTLSDFSVIYLLQSFLNAIFLTVVPLLTRFQVTQRAARSLCGR